jgi:molecular chaperone GrpE (heat shock protein)
MKKAWPWIIGVVVGVVILAWLIVGRAERQAYWTARRAVHARVDASQERIDATVEAATAAVDRALELAGNLPSQQAKADLVKQDIEEIGNRLKEASEAAGDAAIDKLDASIDQFNQALETVNQAEEEATLPAAKAALYRISLILETAQEKVVNFLLTAGQ